MMCQVAGRDAAWMPRSPRAQGDAAPMRIVVGQAVQAEYFPDTRSSGVTVGRLAGGTSSAASDMCGRSHCSAMRS